MLEAPDLHLKLMAFSGHLTKKIKTSPTEMYTVQRTARVYTTVSMFYICATAMYTQLYKYTQLYE